MKWLTESKVTHIAGLFTILALVIGGARWSGKVDEKLVSITGKVDSNHVIINNRFDEFDKRIEELNKKIDDSPAKFIELLKDNGLIVVNLPNGASGSFNFPDGLDESSGKLSAQISPPTSSSEDFGTIEKLN